MISENPGLYCHIPFCKGKCPYCNFYSLGRPSGTHEYIQAIKRETALYARGDLLFNMDTFGTSFDTLYIGGGTPSVLAIDQIRDLISHIFQLFPISDDTEITMEANPGDCTTGYLREISRIGINRLNIGVQSFNPKKLAFLSRRHTETDSERAILNARTAGFTNIGIDLIYGLSCESMDEWEMDIERALSFSPEHIACYQLTIEEKTPFGKRLSQGKLSRISEAKEYRFYIKTVEILEGAGYYHYEISNFAKARGRISRHNSKYWRHIPYLGLGVSAHSFSCGRRWWNHDSMTGYYDPIRMGRLPVAGTEALTDEQLRTETLYFAFRTDHGLDINQFRARFGEDLRETASSLLSKLEAEKKIRIENGIIHTTSRGKAVADALTLLFC